MKENVYFTLLSRLFCYSKHSITVFDVIPVTPHNSRSLSQLQSVT